MNESVIIRELKKRHAFNGYHYNKFLWELFYGHTNGHMIEYVETLIRQLEDIGVLKIIRFVNGSKTIRLTLKGLLEYQRLCLTVPDIMIVKEG